MITRVHSEALTCSKGCFVTVAARVSRDEGPKDRAGWRARHSPVSWLGCLSFLPAHNKQTEAAAGPVCHPGGRRGAERSGGQVWQGAVSFCPHLICAPVGSLPSPPVPQGRIEHIPERQKPLRGHPLTAVPNRLRAARLRVCLSLSPSVCLGAFSHSVDMDRQL